MKNELLTALDACWLKGLTDEVLINVVDGELKADFTSKASTMAGFINMKVPKTMFHDVSFMVLDTSALIKTLSSYKSPTISFKNRTGESGVATPYLVEIKEGRSRMNLVLGITNVFRRAKVKTDRETLFEMIITPELSKSFRNESRLLNIETFFIQENKKHEVVFVISHTHQKTGDFLEIETGFKVDADIPNDMRFDIKSFLSILNQYPDDEIKLSINEKFMTLFVKNQNVQGTYYLSKIKQI